MAVTTNYALELIPDGNTNWGGLTRSNYTTIDTVLGYQHGPLGEHDSILPSAHNTYDWGSASVRPRNIFTGGYVCEGSALYDAYPGSYTATPTAVIDQYPGIDIIVAIDNIQTLGNPTDSTLRRKFYVTNLAGSAGTITVNGQIINPGTTLRFIWSSVDTAWTPLGSAAPTSALIKTLYEANADTNAFTDALLGKLNGVATNANNYVHPNHTGDVTSVGDGALTIGSNKVTLDKIVQLANARMLGRTTAGTGNVESMTVPQVLTMLGVEAGATGDMTPSEILAALLTVDGQTSGLDADKLWGSTGDLFALLASPAFTGTPTAPTAALGTSTTQIATTAFVDVNFARKLDALLTGIPQAPTAASATDTNQLATTAFVHAVHSVNLSSVLPLGNADPAEIGTSDSISREDHRHPVDYTRAPRTHLFFDMTAGAFNNGGTPYEYVMTFDEWDNSTYDMEVDANPAGQWNDVTIVVPLGYPKIFIVDNENPGTNPYNLYFKVADGDPIDPKNTPTLVQRGQRVLMYNNSKHIEGLTISSAGHSVTDISQPEFIGSPEGTPVTKNFTVTEFNNNTFDIEWGVGEVPTSILKSLDHAADNFTISEVITGGTSGATATVVSVDDVTGEVIFSYTNEFNFAEAETITGGASGVSAVVGYVDPGLSRITCTYPLADPFVVGEVITGGTSGATATVTSTSVDDRIGGTLTYVYTNGFTFIDGEIITGFTSAVPTNVVTALTLLPGIVNDLTFTVPDDMPKIFVIDNQNPAGNPFTIWLRNNNVTGDPIGVPIPNASRFILYTNGAHCEGLTAVYLGGSDAVFAFNGRQGQVQALAGDYTAAMVGAYPIGGGVPLLGPLQINMVDAGGGYGLSLLSPDSNAIYFAPNGLGAPTFTQRSLGTKLNLYPAMTGSSADFGLGVETNNAWASVPQSNTTYGFKWYGGITQIARLDGVGNLDINGIFSAADTNLPKINTTGKYASTQTSVICRDLVTAYLGSAATGTLQINLGHDWADTMTSYIIKGYDYSGVGSWEVEVCGYDYIAATTWANNTSYIIKGTTPFNASATPVRLARDTVLGGLCILLGDLTTNWAYAGIELIETRTNGYGSNQTIMRDSTQTMEVLANELDLTNIYTPPLTTRGEKVWTSRTDGSGSGLDADLLEGQHAATAATVNTIVQRTAAGYIYGSMLNAANGLEASTATDYWYSTGDGFLRRKSLANVRTELITSTAVLDGLGYTPADIAGDTFTGNVTVDALFAVTGKTRLGQSTLTADYQNDVSLFSDAAGTAAQSGAFHNRLRLFGGSSETRDFQLYQAAGGYATVDTSWSGNHLVFSANFTQITFNQPIVTTSTVDGRDIAIDGAKLDNIEANAKDDQTAAEIKTAYESNADTNAFTNTLLGKLGGIEPNAKDDQTATEILNLLKTVDGTGSGLDADLFDGLNSSAFAQTSHTHSSIVGGVATNLNNTLPANVGEMAVHSYTNTASNKPVAVDNANACITIRSHVNGGTGGYGKQFAFANNQDFYMRAITDGTWSPWRKLISSNDVTVTATADKIVQRDANGYINGVLFHSSTAAAAATAINYFFDSGDGYIRKKSVATVKAELVTSTQVYSVLNNTTGSVSGSIVFSGRDQGVFGTYNSTLTDQIWSAGTSYRNHSAGTNFGTLIGLAYKHTNNPTGGNMAGGHMTVWCQNGTPYCALGTNIWTSGNLVLGNLATLVATTASNVTIAGNSIWHAGNDGSGSGLDADTLRTFTPDAAASINSIAQRDSNGYIFASYFNSSAPTQTSTATDYWYSVGDGYFRRKPLANVQTEIVTEAAVLTALGQTPVYASGANMTGDLTWGTTYRDKGIIGTYDPAKTQQIWTMGSAYRNHASGTNFGNLYGASYYHTNNGAGTLASGHQMVWCQNGVPKCALGNNLWTAGAVVAAGNVTAYSDIRLKKNIKKIDNAVDKVKELNGYTFDRIDMDTPRQTGVIAQEVLKVLPEAVSGDEEGSLTVAYGNMVGLLIEAIKEQQIEIDGLKRKLGS